MKYFFELEKVIRRAPLGLRFLDLVQGVSINDGLVVTAWQNGTTGPKQLAFSSPMSGIYGFRTLPGLRPYEADERPASEWCAPPPDVGKPTADELADLRNLVSANESATKANFIVCVEDQLRRFLPQVLLMCLPRERLVEVPLFSSLARPRPAGLGVVGGELAIHEGAEYKGPASWALVTATLSDHTYVGIADERGMFSIFVPYASALPPLVELPPRGKEPIDKLTWDVTLRVFSQPEKLRFVPVAPDLNVPDMLSIMEQGKAMVNDKVGNPLAELASKIRLGEM